MGAWKLNVNNIRLNILKLIDRGNCYFTQEPEK